MINTVLPRETLSKIFEYLPINDVQECMRVCDEWKQTIDGDSQIWKAYLERSFNPICYPRSAVPTHCEITAVLTTQKIPALTPAVIAKAAAKTFCIWKRTEIFNLMVALSRIGKLQLYKAPLDIWSDIKDNATPILKQLINLIPAATLYRSLGNQFLTHAIELVSLTPAFNAKEVLDELAKVIVNVHTAKDVEDTILILEESKFYLLTSILIAKMIQRGFKLSNLLASILKNCDTEDLQYAADYIAAQHLLFILRYREIKLSDWIKSGLFTPSSDKSLAFAIIMEFITLAHDPKTCVFGIVVNALKSSGLDKIEDEPFLTDIIELVKNLITVLSDATTPIEEEETPEELFQILHNKTETYLQTSPENPILQLLKNLLTEKLNPLNRIISLEDALPQD